MWKSSEIDARLRVKGLAGKTWGCRGPDAVEQIENGLQLSLDRELRTFVEDVGNLMVSPFEIILGGDDAGRLSAITETQSLWNRFPFLAPLKAVQIMEHAGQVYLAFPTDGHVSAYDSLRPMEGEEILLWKDFNEFVEWVLNEAERFASKSDR